MCHLSPGRGRRRRSFLAYDWPNLRHHLRIASYVTLTPRSKSNSSTSRKLKQKRKYSHTAWLTISTGKRWFLYFVVVAGVSILQLCHTMQGFHKLTMPAPVSLCLACDTEQEQQIVLRRGRRWTWARRFFLGLLTYCFVGGIIKGEFLVLSWIGLAAIGWYMWHRRHTAQVPTTRSGPHKGGHYGTTQNVDSQ